MTIFFGKLSLKMSEKLLKKRKIHFFLSIVKLITKNHNKNRTLIVIKKINKLRVAL